MSSHRAKGALSVLSRPVTSSATASSSRGFSSTPVGPAAVDERSDRGIQSTLLDRPTFLKFAPITPLPRTHNVEVATLNLSAYHHYALDMYVQFALRAAHSLGIPVNNPKFLPTSKELYTVIKAPFIFKKSQENFQRLTHRRLLRVYDANPEVVDLWLRYLKKHAVAGVGMRARVHEFVEFGFGRKEIEGLEAQFDGLGSTAGQEIEAAAAELIKSLGAEDHRAGLVPDAPKDKSGAEGSAARADVEGDTPVRAAGESVEQRSRAETESALSDTLPSGISGGNAPSGDQAVKAEVAAETPAETQARAESQPADSQTNTHPSEIETISPSPPSSSPSSTVLTSSPSSDSPVDTATTKPKRSPKTAKSTDLSSQTPATPSDDPRTKRGRPSKEAPLESSSTAAAPVAAAAAAAAELATAPTPIPSAATGLSEPPVSDSPETPLTIKGDHLESSSGTLSEEKGQSPNASLTGEVSPQEAHDGSHDSGKTVRPRTEQDQIKVEQMVKPDHQGGTSSMKETKVLDPAQLGVTDKE